MLAGFRRLAQASPSLRAALTLARRAWRDGPHARELAADFARTRRETRFLRQAKIDESGPVLTLFALDDDSIYSLKLMAFISQALRLRGWRVQVVLRSRAMLMGRAYLRAFGLRHFVYLSDVSLSEGERAHCRASADRLLGEPLGLQMIKGWHFEGSWIGPQIISTLSRLRFEGMLDFSDPQVLSRLKDMLEPCLAHVLRARALMRTHPADLALTIEANYAMFGPLVDMAIAQGTPVIQMTQPWKDDGLIFRRLTARTRREHPSSVSLESLDRLAGRPWTEREAGELERMFADRYGGRWFLQARNQRNTRAYGYDDLARRFSLDPAKPLAVVFSHVLWDANLFYGDDLFEDYGEWFKETVRAACANPTLNWLVKIHPANAWKRAYEGGEGEYAEAVLIRQAIGELPPHVRLIGADDDVSTMSLFQFADFGVTVRGTSGMEMACFGKPCVTAGTGRYSNLGFTLDCTDRDHYLRRLATLQDQPPMTPEEVLRAKWHAYAAFRLRPWLMNSARAEFANRGPKHPLDHNLFLTVDSLVGLDSNGDLIRWADWAQGADVDYLSDEASPEGDNQG